MRIGIDARMLGPACAGLGRYVEQLVMHLERVSSADVFFIFLRKENWDGIELSNPRFQKVLADIPWYGWLEQVKFTPIIRRCGVDFMHFPHWNVPILYRGPFVVTIHDLIMWHFPREEASTHGPLVYWVKDRVSRMMLRSAAHRAKQIITTSEFTKADLEETLSVPKEKMTVTYQAPFITPWELKSFDVSKFGIVKPYVLYVGNAYPHKNLERLIDAWKLFQDRHGEGYQLVLAGKDSFFYKKLFRYIEMSKCRNVVMTGFVDDATLEALYVGARLYVAPSLYEGFALSALEALARGLPVAVSSSSCFPEVLGEAAVYFDPEQPAYAADVLYQCLSDDALRYELSVCAKTELRRYSWQRLAEETFQVYRSAGDAMLY